MMRFPRIHPLAFAAVLMAVGMMAAEAQPPGGGRRGPGGFGGGPGFGMRGGPGGGGLIGLLRNQQVQDEELKLSDAQKEELRSAAEKLREEGVNVGEVVRERLGEREEIQALSFEERMKKMGEIMAELRPELEKQAKETEKKIAEIIEPAQFKRLKQIELQQQGVDGLVRDDIAQALGLSEEQQQEIKEILEQRGKKMQELGEQMRGAFTGGFRDLSEEEREQARARMEELGEKRRAISSEAQKKGMAVLTADQKAKMPDLMGEPVELRRPERR
ncbi:MAG: Spy/CpxP family protein refolding chaperone, partial [Planctomycetota bacterium]